jgi:hypothetical protein
MSFHAPGSLKSGDSPAQTAKNLVSLRKVSGSKFIHIYFTQGASQMSSFKGFRFKLCLLTWVLLSLTSLVACGPKTPEPPPPLTVEMLKNAEYHSEWPAEGVAKLTDGEYEEEIVPGSASKLVIMVYPDMYAFGDLNGDGVDDAAVVLATSGGGSGTFISLEAVINDQGTPQHVASAELGDRARVESVAIESGEITVELVTHGPDDPMCCPTVEATRKYKLQGDTLVQTAGQD